MSFNDYSDCKIINIRRGTGKYADNVYATLVDKDGVMLITATLEYITKALEERLPQ